MNNIKRTVTKRPPASRPFGCLMYDINFPLFNELLAEINPSDIVKSLDESETHCTVLYGIHRVKDETKMFHFIQMVYNTYKNININFGEVSLFTNAKRKFDVIKIDINSTDLTAINQMVRNNFPYTSDFPIYHPHMTLTYVKAGEGQKYLDRLNEILKKDSNINYSSPNNSVMVYTSIDGYKYEYEQL